MGWNNSGMAAGAASGAAAGSVVPGWGTAIGAVVGGVMGGLSGGEPSGAPPPQTLPGPQAPGGWSTNYGNSWVDPYTGRINQYSYGFDPTQMQAQWDADSMYNQFMGNGNGAITSNIDWQIQKLQQQLDAAKAPGKGANRGAADISDKYGVTRFMGEDGKLQDISDTNAIFDGRINTPAAQALREQFRKDTGGNYGGGGAIGFGKWVRDFYQKSLQPQFGEYQQATRAQEGNQETNTKTIQDLQNQIDFLTQQKGRYTGQNAPGSNNPLLKYTNDIGPQWQAGDNANPYLGGWEGMMRDKMAASGQDPNAIYSQYGVPSASGQGAFQSKMNGLINGLNGYQVTGPGNQPGAPRLDTGAGGAMLNSLNFRSQQNFANQNAARDAQLARRGMGSSAVGELAHSQDSLNLGNELNQNALSAANYFNQNVAQQFGMDTSAAQNQFQNQAQAAAQNNSADLARRGLALQYTNTMNNDLFNQGLSRAQFANTVQNNLFGQAMNSLNANNAMRQQTRDWNAQDYGFGRQENADLYGRQMNMYNLLNTQRQQAFGNQQAQYGLTNQGQSILGGQGMQLADWGNQSNLANAQMRNSWNMYNAQNDAARSNANQAGMWGALGQIGGAFGNYYGSDRSNGGVAPVTSRDYEGSFNLPETYSQNTGSRVGSGVSGNWWEPGSASLGGGSNWSPGSNNAFVSGTQGQGNRNNPWAWG